MKTYRLREYVAEFPKSHVYIRHITEVVPFYVGENYEKMSRMS